MAAKMETRVIPPQAGDPEGAAGAVNTGRARWFYSSILSIQAAHAAEAIEPVEMGEPFRRLRSWRYAAGARTPRRTGGSRPSPAHRQRRMAARADASHRGPARGALRHKPRRERSLAQAAGSRRAGPGDTAVGDVPGVARLRPRRQAEHPADLVGDGAGGSGGAVLVDGVDPLDGGVVARPGQRQGAGDVGRAKRA